MFYVFFGNLQNLDNKVKYDDLLKFYRSAVEKFHRRLELLRWI